MALAMMSPARQRYMLRRYRATISPRLLRRMMLLRYAFIY